MLSLIAFSLQAAFAMAHGGALMTDPNVVVPPSSVENWYDIGRKVHTNLVRWVGPPQLHRGITPIATQLNGPFQGGGPNGGYYPNDIHNAYQIPTTGGTAAIAIVDAFDLATALHDFNTFSTQFGLPVETSSDVTADTNTVFQVVYQTPGVQPYSGPWDDEEALDIEWAHAMAPNAKIYLVEANDTSYSNLLAAEQIAAALPGVRECSNSWGGGESSFETTFDASFVYPNVMFFASSGDSPGPLYPAESPNVVGVGGTSLYMAGDTVSAERGWSASGGGPSAYEPRPSYQSGIQSIVGSQRGSPDIAAVADPYTGVAVYSASPSVGGWTVFGGTSVACPVCAGIYNNMGASQSSSAALLSQLYPELGTDYFRDIVSGRSGPYSATTGWDFVTGLGCPLGGFVAPALTVQAQMKATPGGTISYTIPATSARRPAVSVSAAKTAGPPWVTYNGFTLTITPPLGIRLGNYPVTITATDNGIPSLSTAAGFLVHVANCALQSASFPSTVIASGVPTMLTVNLVSPAPQAGATVTFTNRGPYLTAPASLSFAEGEMTKTVSVSTLAINNTAASYVVVSMGGRSLQIGVRLVAVAPSSLVVSGGNTVSGTSTKTVTLTMAAAAPTGGLRVKLTSSLPGVVGVPSWVIVPAGQTSVQFVASTYAPIATQTATLTAATAGGSTTTTLTVNP